MPKRKPLDYTEFGTTGYYTMSGYLQTEYQTDLTGGKAFEVYEKMYKSGGMQKAMFSAMTLPLRSAKWDIKPANENDKLSIEIKDKVKNNLFDGLDVSFDQLLFNILLYLVYGHYPFEKVWQEPSNEPVKENEFVTKLKKLAPRHPKTIIRWIQDETGSLAFLEQWAYFNKGLNSSYETKLLPIEKIIRFVNEQDGDNFEGISIFRAAYRHYYANDKIYNIANIGVEKQAIGTPVITFDPEIWNLLSSDERTEILTQADTILKNYRTHEYSGIKLPPGLSINVIEGKFNFNAIKELIRHNDQKQAQSILAGFLTTGETNSGSYALAKNQSDFFLMALKAIGNNICDTLNRHLIPELVSYNYENVSEFPKLTFELPDLDYTELMTALRTAADGKLVTPTRSIEQHIRRIMELPELEEEELTISEQVPVMPQVSSSQQFSEEKWRRTSQFDKRVNFDEINKNITTAEDKTLSAINEIYVKQIQDIKKQIDKGVTIDKVNIPYLDKVENIWQESLSSIKIQSAEGVGKEFKAKVNISPEKIKQDASLKAKLLTDKYKSDLLLTIATYYTGKKEAK